MTDEYESDIEYMKKAVSDLLSLVKRYQEERGSVPALLIQHLKNMGDVDEVNLTRCLFETLIDRYEDLLPLLNEYEEGEPGYGPCELSRDQVQPRTLSQKMSGEISHGRAYQ